MKKLLAGQGVLITGGTGTFARAFIPHCLEHGAKRIVALARHEVEMSRLEAEFGTGKRDQMRYYIGDVRNQKRLEMAMRNIDIVIHAAAMKRIEQCERDPFEAIATNVDGSVNTIAACLNTNVKRCILLSTDKAVFPVNLYGSTKMCAERLFIAANNLAAGRCKFGVVRYGNIWGSRGSVVHIWKKAISEGRTIHVTDMEATRFFMPIHDAVKWVQEALTRMNKAPPCTLVPGAKAYVVGDLVKAFDPKRITLVGMPPWEKKHETLDGRMFSNQAPLLSVSALRNELNKLEETA